MGGNWTLRRPSARHLPSGEACFGTARVTRPPLVSGQAGGIETVEPTAKLSFGLTPIFVEQDPGPPPPPIVFDGGN